MIEEFRKNPIWSVQNELGHLLVALDKCPNSKFKTGLRKALKLCMQDVSAEYIKELQEFLGEDGVIVECPKCNGKGTTLKYVGCCCTRDEPYDRVVCTECKGGGQVVAKRAKV